MNPGFPTGPLQIDGLWWVAIVSISVVFLVCFFEAWLERRKG